MQPGEPLFVTLRIRYRGFYPGDPRTWDVTAIPGAGGHPYIALGNSPGVALDLALAGLELIELPSGQPPPPQEAKP